VIGRSPDLVKKKISRKAFHSERAGKQFYVPFDILERINDEDGDQARYLAKHGQEDYPVQTTGIHLPS